MRLFQRDVEIEIEDLDRFGSFFGNIHTSKTENFLSALLAEGHVKLHRSAANLAGFNKFTELELKAKAGLKGVWFAWDQAAEDKRQQEWEQKKKEERLERQQQGGSSRPTEKLLLTVTEIMTGSTFFFQEASEEKKTMMEDLSADLQSRDWHSKPTYSPTQKKEWVAAKFSVDDNWYRAEVLRIITKGEDKEYELRYVDYGNTEITSSANIRKLDQDFSSNKFAGQARKGKLAYVRAPGLDDEFGEDAAALFKELAWGKTLIASVLYKDTNEGDEVWHVQLGDQENKVSINGKLVIEGLARLENRRSARVVHNDIYKLLEQEEGKAKNSRLCIWQYGAIPDSDEDRAWERMLK